MIVVSVLPGDDSKGFFIQPTVILTKDPRSVTMTEEIFGPVVTVSIRFKLNRARWEHIVTQIYVYDDADFEKTLELIDNTSVYALTGSMWVKPGVFDNQILNILVASPLTGKRFSLPRTSCAMRLVMYITTRNARVLLLDSNLLAVRVQAGQMIKQGASTSSIALFQPEALRRTS